MGKKIDRFILTSLFAVLLYFYFEKAFGNKGFALVLSLLGCIVFIQLIKRISCIMSRTQWLKKRKLAKATKSALMHLACMDSNEASNKISILLNKCYQNSSKVEFEPIHPSLHLQEERIFDLWRGHQGEEKLVLCTTGKCSPEGRILASGLKSPRLAIVDSDHLSQLIAEYPDGFFTANAEKKKYHFRLQLAGRLLLNRKNAPRCLLFAFSMLMMYIFSGNASYLVFSLMLLLTALISFHRTSRPAKLF